MGKADGVASPKFAAAVVAFMMDNGCVEIAAQSKSWRKLLGME